MDTKSGFVTTSDNVRLYVESRGEGRPIVFVAGYTATLATWAFQADAAVEAGFRAVCVDRRWHGRSDRPAHGHRIARHAADIRHVVSELELDRPLLVGASMGASVCWSYIDLFGPDALSGMIGIDQTPSMVNRPDWPFGMYGLTEANLGTFFANGVPPTGRGRPYEDSAAGIGRLQARVDDQALFHPATPDTRPLLDDHARQDWRDVICTTLAPMLLLAGSDSQLWPCQHAAATTNENVCVQSIVIDDAGHSLQSDQPALLNQQIFSFATKTEVLCYSM